VGDNGSGKTSILSAVSVALGIWHLSDILGDVQWRNIGEHEVREVLGVGENGEKQFLPAGQVQITARGVIGESDRIEWRRGKRKRGAYTINEDSEQAVDAIEAVLEARENKTQPLPLLGYYGAGRAWQPSNERALAELEGDLKSRQADGYYDCLNERIRIKDVLKWFVLQAAARDESGKFKPSFEAVRLALKQGIPGVDDIYWDSAKAEVVVSIHGLAQPFSNLSDGQRSMAATIADMAIRAVTLNPHLLGDGNGHSHPEEVLKQTPGVVLIDEVDVHLHPGWQRSVVKDLMETFPRVQFICTSHSAQVIGEVPARQVWILGESIPRHPSVSFADSNWVLEHFMGKEADSRNAEVKSLLEQAEEDMSEGDLEDAKASLETARETMGGEDGELTRLESSLATLNALARADD
jgi:predicted ATP-binding protein involved in virulence